MNYHLVTRNILLGSAILFSSILGSAHLGATVGDEVQASQGEASQLQRPNVAKEIKEALIANNYSLVGRLVRENLGKGITLEALRKLAKQYHSTSLMYATEAAKELTANNYLNSERLNLGLTRGQFFQIALFIEHNLPGVIQKGEYYLPKAKTELACSLEYDPQTQAVFILLDDCKNILIGFGSNKVVKKALLYSRKEAQIVARGIQTETKKNEMKITSSVRGAPGLFEIFACTKNTHGAHQCSTIYAKLYKNGSLFSALHKNRFSLYEKAKIALNLLKGLEELHKRDITHRDISSRNCLIDIPQGAPNKRDVVAVLADLGRSDYTWTHFDTTKKPQGHSIYNPPEGIFRAAMKGKDYVCSDIFALGCVLHEVFYGKTAAWQKPKYFSAKAGTEQFRYYKLITKINSETESRYRRLSSKKASGSLSCEEACERLILKMVAANPKKRGNVSDHRHEMEQIFNKLQ